MGLEEGHNEQALRNKMLRENEGRDMEEEDKGGTKDAGRIALLLLGGCATKSNAVVGRKPANLGVYRSCGWGDPLFPATWLDPSESRSTGGARNAPCDVTPEVACRR